jgi:hypothetical protein
VNNCCGYIIRENAPSGPIENIENSNTLDNATVGQKYDGNLSKLLQDLRPSSVLILLGTNQKNAHAALVAAIRAVVPNAVIAWAGPPLLSTSPKIYSNLASSLGQSYPDDQKALESNVSGTNSKVQIINCEHFAGLGDPKETMLHYAGTQAALLASDTIAALK